MFFKLHNAADLRGRSVSLCSKLRLALDGLHGAMRPSEFLASNIWQRRNVSIDIQLVAGELQLRLGMRPIQFLFVISDDDVEDLEALTAAFHRQDWRSLIVVFEQISCLYEISCYPLRGWRSRRLLAPLIETGVDTYMAHVSECVAVQGAYAGSQPK
jgi:hypothetical protein